MPKTAAVVDIPDVNGAFVGTTQRPFTKEEFVKIKSILAKKSGQSKKLIITDRDLRSAGLEYMTVESANGNSRQ
jgi:hypothetical protein